MDLNPDLIRLREKANERLTKIYRDDVILEQYSMFEGKPIALQILKEPEIVNPDIILIMLRSWNPATWELTPMKELLVKRYSTLDEFSHMVHKEFPSISLENIECCKVITVQNFFRLQLPYEKWYGLIGNENFLAANPFYLSTDGLLFIAKDKSLKERELTEEENKMFGCDNFESSIFTTSGPHGSKRPYVPKEKAMKINVKKKKKAGAFDNFEILIPEDKPKDGQAESTDITMETENHDSKMD